MWTTDGMGMIFNAFNLKSGGLVFVQCTFNLCEGMDCLTDNCNGRAKREVISLKGVFVSGKITQG